MSGKCHNCLNISDNCAVASQYRIKIKSDNQLQIATVPGTLGKLLAEIRDKTGKFKQHVFVKNEQANILKQSKL